MNNTRFATAIHILTLLADRPEEWLGSDLIAGSININPVIVRKEISVLNHAGLVITRRGKEGGTKLKKVGEKITLSEVYSAISNSEILGKKNQHPNPKCKIGKQINQKIDKLNKETHHMMMHFLKEKTLADFAKQF